MFDLVWLLLWPGFNEKYTGTTHIIKRSETYIIMIRAQLNRQWINDMDMNIKLKDVIIIVTSSMAIYLSRHVGRVLMSNYNAQRNRDVIIVLSQVKAKSSTFGPSAVLIFVSSKCSDLCTKYIFIHPERATEYTSQCHHMSVISNQRSLFL